MTRHKRQYEGDIIIPIMNGYKMSCCDCGLVHVLDFEVVQQVETHDDGSFVLAELNDPSLRV